MTLAVDIRIERDSAPLAFTFETRSTVTGVFGPSGAGKTSLLHLVAGLLAPTAGTIRIGDDVVFDSERRIDRPVHERAVGIVFQDDRLFPQRSVPGNLRYGVGRRKSHGKRPPASLDEIVRLLDLGPLLNRKVRHLSGGERQRVSLGRALLSTPRLLLLDEPLASLDQGHKAPILTLIARIRDEIGTPMLYVSHDASEILRLTDDLLVIDRGRSVALGSLREVAKHSDAWQTLRAEGSINVLRATVADHDEAAGLTSVTLGPNREGSSVRLVGPLVGHAPGTTLFVAIRPEDVAIALAQVDGVSIRNQVPGTIRAITRHIDRTIVEIDIGVILLVEVSHQTVQQMALAPQRDVWCLVKSNAVRYVGASPSGMIPQS